MGLINEWNKQCSCENYERDEIKRVMSRMISLNDGITTRNNVVVPLEDAAVSSELIIQMAERVLNPYLLLPTYRLAKAALKNAFMLLHLRLGLLQLRILN